MLGLCARVSDGSPPAMEEHGLTDAQHWIAASANDRDRTVTLSERDIEDAKRLLALLAGEEPRCTASALARIAIDPAASRYEQLAEKAREILAARRRRAELFGDAMFGEPAWDMLLMLYATDAGVRYTSARLAEQSQVSKSTAFRWIEHLLAEHLVQLQPHPTDRRSAFLQLSRRGRDMLETYLADPVGSEI